MTEQSDIPPGRESQNLEEQRLSEQAPSSASSPAIRRGKWTAEEEAYALAAIRDFNSGYLDAPPGTTLRAYLSENLRCDPMRVSKKFSGDASIGKKVFRPVTCNDSQTNEISEARAKLSALHQKWKLRLQSHEHEITRKSLVDVAVSDASNVDANPSHDLSSLETDMRWNNDIIKTASWLERADDVLSHEIGTNQVQKEIEDEMMAISSLVSEAPEVLAISKQLLKLLNTSKTIGEASATTTTTTLKATIPSSHTSLGNDSQHNSVNWSESGSKGDEVDDSPTYPMKILAFLSSQAAPVPIIDASCPTSSSTTAATEDAVDFVNFIQSVVQDKK